MVQAETWCHCIGIHGCSQGGRQTESLCLDMEKREVEGRKGGNYGRGGGGGGGVEKAEHSVCRAFKDTFVSPGVCVCVGGGCHVVVVSHYQEGFLGPFPLVCGPTSNIKSQSTHIHNTLQWEMKYAVCTLFLNYLGCFAVVLFMHLLSLSFPLSRKTLFFFFPHWYLIQHCLFSHICMLSPFFSDFQTSQHLSEAKKSQQSLENTYKQLDSVSHP